MKRRTLFAACIAPQLSLFAPRLVAQAPAPAAEASLVRELRAGAVVLLRHTQTDPGVGDPPGWRLEDCKSQRNLSATGIADARRIGRWFAQQGLSVGNVRNSPWCRARDTAQLAFGRSDDWVALANIFEDRSGAETQAAAARQAIEAAPPGQLSVWVSHGVTIAEIVGGAGVGLAQGEAIVVRRGSKPGEPLVALGRLRVP